MSKGNSDSPGSSTELYECVTVIKAIEKDPVNDRHEGDTWFEAGRHFHGNDYEVMAEDVGTQTIPTESVIVIELPDLLPEAEAIELARKQARELVELGQRYVGASSDQEVTS